jgi:thiamine biosynthesis lipoprotein
MVQDEVQRYERRALGSWLRLEIHGPGLVRSATDAGWAAISAEFDAVDLSMSRFRSDSELSRLNATAGADIAVSVGSRLYNGLVSAHRAWRLTHGRFDPRVLNALEELGYRGAPIASRPRSSGRRSTWLRRWPRLREVEIAVPLDLGGIGKGLALRWGWRALHRGLRRSSSVGALVDAGGDLVVGGTPPLGDSWRIGIEDPTGDHRPIAVMAIGGGAICTSSTLVNRWVDHRGRPVHHLIDPATGSPAETGLLSVTVARNDAAWAEVWSKALFVAGADDIGPLARAHGLAAWWTRTPATLEMTPAARQMTIWTA